RSRPSSCSNGWSEGRDEPSAISHQRSGEGRTRSEVMAKLKIATQFLMMQQSSPGIEPAAFSATPASYVVPGVAESSTIFRVNEHERQLEDGYITTKEHLAGSRQGEIHRTCELAGKVSDNSGAGPRWYDFALALGMVKTQVKSIAVGAVTGPGFRIHEIIGNNASLGSATKTARFVHLA